MDLFETIGRRHSYRGPFLERPVPRDDLTRIVQAGIQAPSGYNGQSTTFVVVDDASLIGRIGADSGDYFFIGNEKGALRMRGAGRLFLGINDDYLEDNRGNFRVTGYY